MRIALLGMEDEQGFQLRKIKIRRSPPINIKYVKNKKYVSISQVKYKLCKE